MRRIVTYFLCSGLFVFTFCFANGQKVSFAEAEFGLLEAAWDGDTVIAAELLAFGIDPNARGITGTTPLIYAAMQGHVLIAEMLLEAGAWPDISDDEGKQAFHHAVLSGDTLHLDFWLSTLIDVNHQTREGYTALVYAAQTPNIALARELVVRGALVDLPGNNGTTPLMHAAAYGHFFMVDFLLFAGADINHQAADGSGALHMAAWYGHSEIIGLLLDLGADLELADKRGNTPLMYAIIAGNIITTWYLAESGASLVALNDEDFTPLALATARNHTELVKLLFGYDYPEPMVDSKSNSVFSRAIYSRNPEIIGLVRRLPGKSMKGLYPSDFMVGAALEFNSGDLMYRIDMGVLEARFRMKLEASYARRFFSRKVEQFQPPATMYIFMENRSNITLNLQREILAYSLGMHNVGLYMGGALLYSTAGYQGAETEAPGGLRLAPTVDVYYRHRNFSLNGAWLFQPTGQSAIPPHRFVAGIRYYFPLVSSRILRLQPAVR